jgi:hypothetical protein
VKGPVEYRDDGHDHECGRDGPHLSHADALGIENMAAHGMQGRGVLIDLQRHFGQARQLVGYDELNNVMAANGVTVERGDFLVLRTGFAELMTEMPGNPDPQVLHHTCSVLNGRDERLLNWITESGISAICADNYAVEAYPAVGVKGKKSLLPFASSLPVQARCTAGRALVSARTCRMAARAQAKPFHADRAAAASAGRCRFAGYADNHCLIRSTSGRHDSQAG